METAIRHAHDLLTRYQAKTPTSAALYERARAVIPGGVVHDSRYLKPHPLYVERAAGAHKWDVDGNEYIDYVGGHGALLLGHNHPQVLERVAWQLEQGTHFGACHELEVRWAEAIQEIVPCAERVRFTNSGTESTLLAIRLARAATGKTKILRFLGHFHGWHDQVAFGATGHFDGRAPAGVLERVVEQAILCPANDLAALERALADPLVAAVIVEPTGGSFGKMPLVDGFLAELRERTGRRGVLLIFDEVITGFRVSPGGAGAHYGIRPDLVTLAKIVAGGFPGGAVAGAAEIMEQMTLRDDLAWNAAHRVAQQGTYNANPVAAAAGLATLQIVAQGEVTARANELGELLRTRSNELLRAAGSDWLVYGQFSGFHLFTNPMHRAVSLEEIAQNKVPFSELRGHPAGVTTDQIRCATILSGVDIFGWPGGCVSAVHSEADIEQTAEALVQCWRWVADR